MTTALEAIQKALTRRTFLKGGAAGAATLLWAGCGYFPAEEGAAYAPWNYPSNETRPENLAVGAAIKKPIVLDDGTLGVGHEMSMTMSSDHRVIDGAMAAEYLQTVKGYLENPASILV